MHEHPNALWKQVRAERKKRNYIFWTTVTLFFLYLGITLVFGDMGLIKHYKLAGKRDSLKLELAQVRKENAQIKATLDDFRKNEYLLEKHAREEFGLSKKDELIFLFEEEKEKKEEKD